MTLEELKRQATEEFDKQWTEIMGLETDPDGQEDMYLIYDDNEEVVNAIDFSPEKLGIKNFIDSLISKAYEEGKKQIKYKGLTAKIIGFTKLENGEDGDCIAITQKGEEIIIDPFVGNSWEYSQRELLINNWINDENAWQADDGVWLTNEHSFKLLVKQL